MLQIYMYQDRQGWHVRAKSWAAVLTVIKVLAMIRELVNIWCTKDAQKKKEKFGALMFRAVGRYFRCAR
jgi:hypothetical protein